MQTEASKTDIETARKNAYLAGVLTPFIAPATVAAITVPPLLVKAWVLSWLWAWYAQPMGAPALRPTVAFGICLMFGMLTAKVSKPPANDFSAWQKMQGQVIGPMIYLFIGWLVSFFV